MNRETIDLMDELRLAGVQLSSRDGRLRVSAPAGRMTPELQERLRQHKESILEALSRGALPPIPITDRGAPIPVSLSQQRLWLMDRMDPGNPAYNLVQAHRLHATLDTAVLEKALVLLAERHETLRTTFHDEGGVPVQRIHPSMSFPVDVLDLRDLPPDQREAAAEERIRRESLHSFNLEEGPLLRALRIRLEDSEEYLVFVLHHIIADGWSMQILRREVGALYEAVYTGAPSPLPPLPVQFADYAAWHRKAVEGEVEQADAEYWSRKLSGIEPVLELPTDRPRPQQRSHAGAVHRFNVDAGLTRELNRVARANDATLFMALLSAFATLLHRYTGSTDFCIGAPVAGRTRPETEPMIAMLVNTVVLRMELEGDPTFRELLVRNRTTTLEALEHQALGFEKLITLLDVPRSTAHTPVFQVFFGMEEVSAEDEAGVVRTLEVNLPTAKFDLTVNVEHSTKGLRVTFEYSTDLFNADTIERMAGHFVELLRSVVESPAERISRLRLMGEEERRMVLERWNPEPTTWQGPACVHEAIGEAARLRPGAVAVSMGDRTLTYGQLIERADWLAHRLVHHGVGLETLVGVCMERSPEMVIALLAIWKAGAAYVPLDPGFPRERLEYMVADAQLRLVLTDGPNSDRFPEVEMLRVDNATEPDQANGVTLPVARQENLAYAIYTSGSTGRPKGTMIEHRALMNFLRSMAIEPGMEAGQRLLSVTTLSFDIAALELWLPLIVGAEVRLVSRETAAIGERLRDEIERSRPDILQATPVTWRLLFDAGWKGSRDLKALCGGEAMSRELARDLLERCGRVWNMYGPTETTVWSTLHELHPDEDWISIGRPIANTQVHILDPQMQVTPIGVPGELFIGGDGLARGYWNREKLTAERFVENPFGPGRLYRTGDRARLRSDGRLECLGRLDHQVKLRGFRIEPGEIESRLLEHETVREAVVVLTGSGGADQELVAYVTPGGETPLNPSELRRHLSARLPEYMVPAFVICLDAIPRTPNGKIDRKALPPPDLSGRPACESVMPRDRHEGQLFAIWSSLLPGRKFGVTDDFFEVGGNSLLAARMVSEIQRLMEVEVRLAELFHSRTIESLAKVVAAGGSQSRWECLVPIRPKGSKAPLFMVHGIGGNLLCYRQLIACLGEDRPIYGLQAVGAVGNRTPLERVEAMASHYIAEMRELLPNGPYHLLGASFGGTVVYEMACQLAEAGQPPGLVVMVDTLRNDPRDITARIRMQLLWERVAHHLGELARNPFAHIRRKYKTLRRRVETRFYRAARTVYSSVAASPVPTRFMRVQDALRLAAGLHRARPSPVALTLFRCRRQPLGVLASADLGWGSVARGGVTVDEVPGDHTSILTMPDVAVVAEKLTAALDVFEQSNRSNTQEVS